MINLPNVTLFGIDCVDPGRLLSVMEYSSRFIKFADIVILTDTKRHATMPTHIDRGSIKVPIRIIHHEQSDRKVECPRKDHYLLPIDYEMASLREPSLHVKTSHLLFIEYDSSVLSPWAWDNAWLKWDFIGAPWPPHYEPGWPPCFGDDDDSVGNGGFSLRSVEYCAATREATDMFKEDPEWGPGMISSDMWPCRTVRPWLESKRVKFAPMAVAAKFSCENSIFSGQFGYHGKHTALLNGWGSRFPRP